MKTFKNKNINQSTLAISHGRVLVDTTNTKSYSGLSNKNREITDENAVRGRHLKKETQVVDSKCELTKKSVSIGIQTDFETEIKIQKEKEMLTSETAPLEYWKRLAETRRMILDKYFRENNELKEEILYLKQDREVMQEMINEAKTLAGLVQEITSECGEVETV